jgi:YgiT-type zinc finger domain-containing protein
MNARPYSSCSYCGSTVEERHVRMEMRVGDSFVIFENVPAGVCDHCGEEYIRADVQEKMVALTKTPAKKTIEVPVYPFADPLTVAKAAAKSKKRDHAKAEETDYRDDSVQYASEEEISDLLEMNFEESEDPLL